MAKGRRLLQTDDVIKHIENTFLGPRGFTFPWRARMGAYFPVGFIVCLGVLLFLRWLGITAFEPFVILWALGTWQITKRIMRHVSFETPVKTLLVIFWHGVSAPREPTGKSGALSLSRVRVGPKPSRRRPSATAAVDTLRRSRRQDR